MYSCLLLPHSTVMSTTTTASSYSVHGCLMTSCIGIAVQLGQQQQLEVTVCTVVYCYSTVQSCQQQQQQQQPAVKVCTVI